MKETKKTFSVSHSGLTYPYSISSVEELCMVTKARGGNNIFSK